MKIDIKSYPNGDTFVILEEYPFVFQGQTYTVPVGYRSDGASVPRFFWRMLSPKIDSQTLDASVVHDYMYDKKIGTRLEADRYYLIGLLLHGYPAWKCILTYIGVRAIGWAHRH